MTQERNAANAAGGGQVLVRRLPFRKTTPISSLNSFCLRSRLFVATILLLQATNCRSLNVHHDTTFWNRISHFIHYQRKRPSAQNPNANPNPNLNPNLNPNPNQHRSAPKAPTHDFGALTNRRRLLFESVCVATTASSIIWQLPEIANASGEDAADNTGIVAVRLESPNDSLGVEIYDTILRGQNIVAIRRIVTPNKNNRLLREGMILRSENGSGYTSRELVQRLRTGPYPLEIRFANLAAGGDAISDLGTSIVTPKDALDLAQQTETNANTNANVSGNIDGKQQYTTSQQIQPSRRVEYSITTVRQTSNECAIKSRRNDVLEIDYEASYVEADTGKKVIYDASAFRGTGNRPYQMVLGSGDVIPGVDQGLYDMCPGEKRVLRIPPVLGHGPTSRKLYRIPDDHRNLEWEVGLVTIDSTIREDNNVVSRDERESRFAY